jgi:hypothetical protein
LSEFGLEVGGGGGYKLLQKFVCLTSLPFETHRVLTSGKILIPQIEVLPTAVVANKDSPPELEIRFDMPWGPDFEVMDAPLPPNWALRFIHNQLFKHFSNPSRFCPGAFHSTIVRKAEFRSPSVSGCICSSVLSCHNLNEHTFF